MITAVKWSQDRSGAGRRNSKEIYYYWLYAKIVFFDSLNTITHISSHGYDIFFSVDISTWTPHISILNCLFT